MRRARLMPGLAGAIVCLLLSPATGVAATLGSISGHVTSAPGQVPLSGIMACAYHAAEFSYAGCQATDSTGAYAIAELQPGAYKVQFSVASGSGDNYLSQYYDGKATFGTANFVNVVAGAASEGIDAELQPGGQITGTVTEAGGSSSLAHIEVCASQPAEPAFVCAQTDSAGEYAISALPSGHYTVSFAPGFAETSPGHFGQLNYVKQFYDGVSREAEASQVDVTAGAVHPNVDAAMEPGATISGTVTSAAGHAPLNGVQACAYPAGSTFTTFCGSTDPGGEYTIAGLATGSYKVKFSPSGFGSTYAPQYYDGKSTLAAADSISVTAGTGQDGIDAELAELGKISGTVTAEGGGLLQGIHVCAPPEFASKCADTDSNGDYTIEGLAEGSYVVAFDGGQEHASEYYDGAASQSDATRVPVSLATTTTGIDAELAPAGKVEGRVTDGASGDPLEGIQACPLNPSGAGGPAGDCATTGADGRYRIGGLSAGAYRIRFADPGPSQGYLTQYYDGKSIPGEGTVLPVAAGETVSSIDARMEAAGRIGGRVVSASGGAALQGIRVCAVSPRFNVGLFTCTATDAGGEYLLSGLATGSYKVRFSAEGNGNYLDRYYSDEPSRKLAKPVSVTAGATTTGVDAAMHAGGEISGRAIDAASQEPLAGVFVCARRAGQPDFEAGGTMCDYTDSNGEYEIGMLPTASYFVRFSPGPTPPGYLRQYYDGKGSEAESTPVSVTAGSTTAGIDAAMEVGGEIAGEVTDAIAHDPAPSVEVCALVADGGEEEAAACDSTDSSGEYAIEGLATGTYEVQFTPGGGFGLEGEPPNYAYATQYYDGKGSAAGADPVQVIAGSTTAAIDAAMAAGGKIAGTVLDFAGGEPIRDVQACALTAVGGQYSRCASTDASGHYAIEGLAAGDYEVRFQASGGFGEEPNYLPRYYDEQPSPAGATAVPVSAGTTASGVDAKLRAGGQIAGRVTAAAGGAPLQSVEVCVLEAGGAGELLSCATTDVNGLYAVSSLPTGSYKVEFSLGFPDGEGGTEAAFLTQFFPARPSAELAEPVAVTAGSTAGSIDAQMVEPSIGGGEGGGGEGPGGGDSDGGASPGTAPAQPVSPPSTPPPPPRGKPPRRPKPAPSRCGKGKRRIKVHGKTRCVKIRHRHPHRRP